MATPVTQIKGGGCHRHDSKMPVTPENTYRRERVSKPTKNIVKCFNKPWFGNHDFIIHTSFLFVKYMMSSVCVCYN